MAQQGRGRPAARGGRLPDAPTCLPARRAVCPPQRRGHRRHATGCSRPGWRTDTARSGGQGRQVSGDPDSAVGREHHRDRRRVSRRPRRLSHRHLTVLDKRPQHPDAPPLNQGHGQAVGRRGRPAVGGTHVPRPPADMGNATEKPGCRLTPRL